jgi:hypothetical protein
MDSMHEPCPKCGDQPAVTNGPTYWTVYCEKSHFAGRVSATPMRTRSAALQAWDDGVKSNLIR